MPVPPRAFFALSVLVAVLVLPSTAGAQHLNGNQWEDWNLFGQRTYAVDQVVVPQKTNRKTFFALVMDFEHVSSNAYVGIQQDGTSFYARRARFSIWNSLYAKPGSGATCEDFGGEGVGKTCTLPFWFVDGRSYTLRVGKVGSAYGINIWRAEIFDATSGRTFHIGDIGAAPYSGAIDKLANFNEYYGRAMPCDRVPQSAVFFLAPRLNWSTYTGYAPPGYRGSCSGGRVTRGYGGTSLQLGA